MRITGRTRIAARRSVAHSSGLSQLLSADDCLSLIGSVARDVVVGTIEGVLQNFLKSCTIVLSGSECQAWDTQVHAVAWHGLRSQPPSDCCASRPPWEGLFWERLLLKYSERGHLSAIGSAVTGTSWPRFQMVPIAKGPIVNTCCKWSQLAQWAPVVKSQLGPVATGLTDSTSPDTQLQPFWPPSLPAATWSVPPSCQLGVLAACTAEESSNNLHNTTLLS